MANAPASAHARAVGRAGLLTACATCNWSWVNVPVLSNTTVSTLANVSSACKRRTNTPPFAKRPAVANMAVGVANDKAQGQVTIRTATATDKACWGSIRHHTKPAPMASKKTTIKNGVAMRSASCASRGFSVLARSIKETIAANRVSRPTCVTRKRNGPPTLRLPAIKASPVTWCTGRDSPVSRDSSRVTSSSKAMPSAGKACPVATITVSSTTKRRAEINCSRPSAARTSTACGSRCMMASSAPAVRSLALSSQ